MRKIIRNNENKALESHTTLDREQFSRAMISGAALLNLAPSQSDLDLLYQYYSELARWNRHINLVSRRDQDWVGTHFLDSMVPLGMGLVSGQELTLDLGSGAGFPGIPMRIARPGLRLFLVEASAGKCVFLRHVVRSLGLNDVEILQGRSRVFQEQGLFKGKMDLVLTRAAARPAKALAWAFPFLREGGRVLVYTVEGLIDKGVGNIHPYNGPGVHEDRVIWEVCGEEIG